MPFERRELERLYRECGQQLFTCALAITCSPSRAEDAVHDAFCRLLRGQAATGTEAADLKAYAFRAVRNAAIDDTCASAPVVLSTSNQSMFAPPLTYAT